MNIAHLQVSVVIDDARVECDASPINFKPTIMFQTRLFNFTLKNTGLGKVDYKWAVTTLDGKPDLSGIYAVGPTRDAPSDALPLVFVAVC